MHSVNPSYRNCLSEIRGPETAMKAGCLAEFVQTISPWWAPVLAHQNLAIYLVKFRFHSSSCLPRFTPPRRNGKSMISAAQWACISGLRCAILDAAAPSGL